MTKAEEPILKDAKEDDFTCITFQPDLSKFKMDKLDEDTVALMARRAYDIAACTNGVKVYLNDKKLPISKFEDYCKLYLTDEVDECGNLIKIIYDKPGPRWEIAIACSDIGFQQVSFANSIATTKGGRHVDYICDQLVKHLGELVNKKNKNGNPVKPFQIKNYMWVFINCLIENPTFDSQTKENMTLQTKNFGSKCQFSDDFIKKISKCGIVEKILNWLAFKEKTDLEKTGAKSKQTKIKGIPKLDDANDAGTKESMNCTLILTEGDSAKTLAVAGLGVIGRDRYGVFPLRGKMLNVREASTKQILENAEVTSLCKIIGLNFKETYETKESLKQLRYGKLMIMTDQDHDGSHIKGLIINFVHHKWPNLLKHGFVEEFITPIVKVSKGNRELSFYSMPEFEEWQNNTENWQTWKLKYYKGLGTSTSKEAKEYFTDMNRHRIRFQYGSARDDLAIQLAFSKKYVDERKDWLTKFMDDRKVRREQSLPDVYLYQKDTATVNYTDFINKELVLFSNLDNERSIPCLVDGFKPGQRKVLFTCFKRNLHKEIKVAQLAGSVAELSAYHHGEQSLMSTIINLAQNFVGSNNINLLQPIGQFGTRLHGGKDAASPRYIFTALSPLTRLLFNPKDDPLFNYLNDDGLKVEPDWYCPIIPTVLINGAEGIGTGWSTKLPNYNPREIIKNIKKMINNEEPTSMIPYYKNFRGSIERLDDIRVLTSGEVAVIGENTIEITELPIGTWTQTYKEQVLQVFLDGQEKVPACISDYREYHTDTTVRFVVKMTPEQFRQARQTGLHKFFKLQKNISLNSIVLFDQNGCLKRYESAIEILKEFFHLRLKYYEKRKAYLEGALTAESVRLDNIARFIMEKIQGKIKVENLKKAEIVQILRKAGYDADPINKWKQKISREFGYQTEEQPNNDNENESEESNDADKKDYDYILSMPIWNLTMEKKEDILKQQKQKGEELRLLREKTKEMLWLDDLEEFLAELDKVEAKEKDDETISQAKTFKASKAAAAASNSRAAKNQTKRAEYLPDPSGERIEPAIDPQLIAKVEKDSGGTKVKTEKTNKKDEINIVDIISGELKLDENEIIELAERLSKPPKKETAAAKKEREKETKAKGIKKEKNDENEDIIIDETTNDVDESIKKTTSIVKVEKAAPKKMTESNDEPKKSKATKTKEPAGASKKKLAKKESPNAKDKQKSLDTYFKKKKNVSSSESDGDDSSIEEISISEDFATSRSPRSTRTKKPISYKIDDENSKDSSDKVKKDATSDDDSYNTDKENSTKKRVQKIDSEEEDVKPSLIKKKVLTKKSENEDSKKKVEPSTTKKKTVSETATKAKPLTEKKQNAKTKKSKFSVRDSDDEEGFDDDDDDDFVVDDDFSPKKSKTKKGKKKLLDKNGGTFSSDDESQNTKRRKKNITDDDLYAMDD